MTTHTTPLDIPFPPDPNPRKPKMAVPPGTWDSHFHIFGPPHRFPYADTRRYSPPTAPIEHWLSVSKAIGVERGTMQGWTRCSSPSSVSRAMPRSLMR